MPFASTGRWRATKAASRGGRTQPGETVTFRFEYEVLEPVPNLALRFDCTVRPEEHRHGENIVTEICEVLSAEALEAGKTGAVELTLPRLS